MHISLQKSTNACLPIIARMFVTRLLEDIHVDVMPGFPCRLIFTRVQVQSDRFITYIKINE